VGGFTTVEATWRQASGAPLSTINYQFLLSCSGKRAELERAPCARWVKGEGFFLFSDFGFWWAANNTLATMHNRKAASASSTNKRVVVI
jgi:hypothetical protein